MNLSGRQRQSRFLPALALLTMITYAAQGDELQLPAFTRDLAQDPQSGVLAFSHTVKGTSFGLPGKQDSLVHHPEWWSLAPLALGDGMFLLAGRNRDLRLVQTTVSGDTVTATELALWDSEGIPTHCARRDETLFVAAGGAGLLVYEWPGFKEEPRLRGRFPFVDYSKEIALGEDDFLFLADNRDTGLQVIEVAELQRPTWHARRPTGFIDSVSRHGGIIAAADRRRGVILYDVTTPGNPVEAAFIPVQATDRARENVVLRVRFDQKGRLLVIESDAPARVFQVAQDEGGCSAVELWPKESAGQVIQEGIWLDDGRLALISEENKLNVGSAEAVNLPE